ncbi:hypothetical protein RHGRI_037809 [Rhododendron griersonianum]|uniref:Uncharacterized protein ycf23 n=1 Tax=Rhododendron griersonianum TaxID=479676 RepID=A0AAV6HT52_9ERIC|nr:hypothetical protein RHGRI_037809 [Rhododendron griersonianum]
MSSSISIPLSPTTHTQPFLKPRENNLLFGGSLLPKRLPFPKRRVSYTATRALLSANKESVLHDFHERRALKIITGLQNFCRDNVASVVIAADKGGATHVDIACDPELVKLATSLTSLPVNPLIETSVSVINALIYLVLFRIRCLPVILDMSSYGPANTIHWAVDNTHIMAIEISTHPQCTLHVMHNLRAVIGIFQILIGKKTLSKICVSSVTPAAFPAAVEAGAVMVEIGNYDSFYEMGVLFSPEQILNLTKETRRILPSVTLSVTVPHTLSLPDQIKLAEQLEQEGVDIIQTEGGKCSNATNAGVLGLIEKATPTLASAYSISRAVKIPVMCSSGLSAVTAPMAITAGAAGVGVGSAINKLNDVVAMIAEVRSIADSLGISSDRQTVVEEKALRL